MSPAWILDVGNAIIVVFPLVAQCSDAQRSCVHAQDGSDRRGLGPSVRILNEREL